MSIQIRTLRKQDEKEAVRFAVSGMHFDWYFNSSILLQAYGRYFWALESNCATQVIAAYEGEILAGVLLAKMEGEPVVRHSRRKALYVRAFDFIAHIFSKNGAGLYERTNQELYRRYCRNNRPDGEMRFLAANPDLQGRGIGTLLLDELIRREPGKKLFLFTDSACTYQFYEHRGFDRAEEEDVVLDFGEKKVPLGCYLYSGILQQASSGLKNNPQSAALLHSPRNGCHAEAARTVNRREAAFAERGQL